MAGPGGGERCSAPGPLAAAWSPTCAYITGETQPSSVPRKKRSDPLFFNQQTGKKLSLPFLLGNKGQTVLHKVL